MRRRSAPLLLAVLLLTQAPVTSGAQPPDLPAAEPVVPHGSGEPETGAASPAPPTPTPSPVASPVPSDLAPAPSVTAPPSPTTAAPVADGSSEPAASASVAPASPEPAATAGVAPASPEPAATAAPSQPAPAASTAAQASPPAARAPLDVTGRWIVILRDGADPAGVRDRHARRDGLRAERLFTHVARGFVGQLTDRQVVALRADPDVAALVPDEVVEVASQLVPNGVSRVGGRRSPMARIDGVDQRIDADVAVVDTGIDATHPDLNVVGGYNCSTSDPNLWRDRQGHGTHVAGTVGAIDDANGVVGVAPGVRLWAVKILNDDGFGYLSWYVCGLDWIAAQRDPQDRGRPLIEAVNMSVAKWGRDDNNCGATNADILHAAICRVTAGGVTVVAAAANDSGSASLRVPAAYNEVITVSALADGDGKSGGFRGTFNCNGGSYDQDDTFGNFSNYGSDVDIIAPGKCIWSSLPGNRYGYSTGTSMATPAVTGAAALYLATRPWATPGTTKSALQYLGNLGWFTSTDPDSVHERLLDVSRLGPAGDFSVAIGGSAAVGEAGGTITVPVTISRTPTHFERVTLAVEAEAPVTATLGHSSLMGFTATATTLTLTVPPSTRAGRYLVKVTAVEGPRVRQASTQVVVENDPPSAFPPVAAPARNHALGGETAPLRITWPAATDATSAIAEYQIEQAVDWGAWGSTVTVGGSTLAIVRHVALDHVHQFRVRARDAAGNWSEWAAGGAFRLGAVDSASTAIRYSASWYSVDSRWAYRQTLRRTIRTDATARLTATGRTFALVAPVSTTQGWVKVYVNGILQARVSLYSSTGISRRIVWSQTFATDETRLIELRTERTSTRYRVDIDAIVVQR